MDSQKVDEKYVENCLKKINSKMEKYLGKQILENLTLELLQLILIRN